MVSRWRHFWQWGRSHIYVWKLMLVGMRLRVPRDPALPAMLISGPGGPPVSPVRVERSVAATLMKSGILWKICEHRTGDEKAWRIGWREAGLDGDVADWYVPLQ